MRKSSAVGDAGGVSWCWSRDAPPPVQEQVLGGFSEGCQYWEGGPGAGMPPQYRSSLGGEGVVRDRFWCGGGVPFPPPSSRFGGDL